MPLFDSALGDISYPVAAAKLAVASFAFNANAAAAATALTAANISGGAVKTTLALTGTLGAAANAQLPTVAQLLAAMPQAVNGQTYELSILNEDAGETWTLTTNTGWTLNGTMTIPTATSRQLLVTITSVANATATIQNIGSGTV
jgi:hypothetical protein